MDNAILLKIFICVLVLISFVLFKKKVWLQAFVIENDIIILAVSRLFPFYFLYILLDTSVPSDLSSVYYPQATSVLKRQIPYQDFSSSYGFLYGYLNAGLLCLWNSPKIIVLFAIVVEIITYSIWKFVVIKQQLFASKYFSFLYIFNPLCIINTSVVGQNQILIAFFLSVLFIKRRYSYAQGILCVLSAVIVKFLSLLFFPPILFITRHRFRFVFGAVISISAYFLLGSILDIDILQPLKLERNEVTSGNLMYFLFGTISYLFNRDYASYKVFMDVCFYLALIATFSLVYVKRQIPDFFYLTISMTVIGLCLMFFSKKSYTNYMVIFWIPFIITILHTSKSDRMIWHLIFFNAISALEPSLWFRLVKLKTLETILSDVRFNESVFIFVELVQLSYLSFFLYTVVASFLKEEEYLAGQVNSVRRLNTS